MASPFDEVAKEVKTLTGGAISFEIAERLRERVLEACQPNGAGDPLSGDDKVRETGNAWCMAAVSHLLAHKWLLPAKSLLYDLWDRYAKLQRSKKKWVHRALISQLLTEAAYSGGQLERFSSAQRGF